MESTAFDTLTKTVVGSIIVVLIIAIAVLYRALIAEKDTRLNESKEREKTIADAFSNSTETYKMFAEKIDVSKRKRK